MKQASARRLILRPDSLDEVRAEAARLLRRAKAMGVFPTPVDQLVEAAGVEELQGVEEAKERFMARAPRAMREALESAWRKLRGFADIVTGTTYVLADNQTARRKWVRLHELGHQKLPWQKDAALFQDDAHSVSPACEELFEREANAFASELFFQTDRLPPLRRAAGETFNEVFNLSDQFGASRHATARRRAEEARDPAVLLTYYPSSYTFGTDGQPKLRLSGAHSASEAFLVKFAGLELPLWLENDSEWSLARDRGVIATGTERFRVDGSDVTFQWESWWNSHCLLVFLWKPQGFRILQVR